MDINKDLCEVREGSTKSFRNLNDEWETNVTPTLTVVYFCTKNHDRAKSFFLENQASDIERYMGNPNWQQCSQEDAASIWNEESED